MANIKKIPRVKLIIGVMYCENDLLEKVISILKKKFGVISDSIEYNFNFTDYYLPEMGATLKKRLLIFNEAIDREDISKIKRWTNLLESKFSSRNKRRVNIDPGYMTMHNVVLASAKELPHRPYLDKGIFADVVLSYKDNEFRHNDHTFPDYKADSVKQFLKKNRK